MEAANVLAITLLSMASRLATEPGQALMREGARVGRVLRRVLTVLVIIRVLAVVVVVLAVVVVVVVALAAAVVVVVVVGGGGYRRAVTPSRRPSFLPSAEDRSRRGAAPRGRCRAACGGSSAAWASSSSPWPCCCCRPSRARLGRTNLAFAFGRRRAYFCGRPGTLPGFEHLQSCRAAPPRGRFTCAACGGSSAAWASSSSPVAAPCRRPSRARPTRPHESRVCIPGRRRLTFAWAAGDSLGSSTCKSCRAAPLSRSLHLRCLRRLVRCSVVIVAAGRAAAAA